MASMSEASARRRRAALQWISQCCRRRYTFVEQPRHGSPAELYRPSRLLMRYSGGLLYVPKDL
eukprot:3138032-Prymnesium_polylepis.1